MKEFKENLIIIFQAILYSIIGTIMFMFIFIILYLIYEVIA